MKLYAKEGQSMSMGDTIEEKFLGKFEYLALVLFIIMLLLLLILNMPERLEAVGPWVE